MACNILSIEVYDNSSGKVLEQIVNSSSCQVNTSKLKTGVYIFKIISGEGTISKQVVVK